MSNKLQTTRFERKDFSLIVCESWRRANKVARIIRVSYNATHATVLWL